MLGYARRKAVWNNSFQSLSFSAYDVAKTHLVRFDNVCALRFSAPIFACRSSMFFFNWFVFSSLQGAMNASDVRGEKASAGSKTHMTTLVFSKFCFSSSRASSVSCTFWIKNKLRSSSCEKMSSSCCGSLKYISSTSFKPTETVNPWPQNEEQINFYLFSKIARISSILNYLLPLGPLSPSSRSVSSLKANNEMSCPTIALIRSRCSGGVRLS